MSEIASFPKPSQLLPQVKILDPLAIKIFLDVLFLKMGKSTRGKTPNIDPHLNPVFSQKGQKFVEGSAARS